MLVNTIQKQFSIFKFLFTYLMKYYIQKRFQNSYRYMIYRSELDIIIYNQSLPI